MWGKLSGSGFTEFKYITSRPMQCLFLLVSFLWKILNSMCAQKTHLNCRPKRFFTNYGIFGCLVCGCFFCCCCFWGGFFWLVWFWFWFLWVFWFVLVFGCLFLFSLLFTVTYSEYWKPWKNIYFRTWMLVNRVINWIVKGVLFWTILSQNKW